MDEHELKTGATSVEGVSGCSFGPGSDYEKSQLTLITKRMVAIMSWHWCLLTLRYTKYSTYPHFPTLLLLVLQQLFRIQQSCHRVLLLESLQAEHLHVLHRHRAGILSIALTIVSSLATSACVAQSTR